MKKLILTTLTICFAMNLQAQEISQNAIGLRLGNNDGFGAEVSYQHKLSSENRLELDLGWRANDTVNALKLAGLYQWVWNLDGDFNWYAGAGGGLGSWSYANKYKNLPGFNNATTSGVYFFGAGDIGIEYNFDIPLLVSLDFRPEFNINGYGTNYGSDIALSARYKF
jgi:hypothetical protein